MPKKKRGPMVNSQDIFCILINAENEERPPERHYLTESYEGEFTDNARAVAKVGLEENYMEEGEGPIQEAVIAGVHRLRDFELLNGNQAAREAGYEDDGTSSSSAGDSSCDDAAYWKNVALWMADMHVENVQQGRTPKSSQDLLYKCLSAVRGGLSHGSYRRDKYTVVKRLQDAAKKLED